MATTKIDPQLPIVTIVLDPLFSRDLRELIACGPVWIVDSAQNRQTAEAAWTSLPARSMLLTTFKAEVGWSTNEVACDILETVVEHHPAWSVLVFMGTTASPSLSQALKCLAEGNLEVCANGFRYARRLELG